MQAVSDIDELKQAATTKKILVQTGAKETDYNSCVQRLNPAVIQYDAQQQAKDSIRSSFCRCTNNVNLHSPTDNDDDSDSDDLEDTPVFDVGSSVYDIHAAIQRNRHRPPKSRRPGNTPADIWRQIPSSK
jgi:hypothetical protein